MNKNTCILYRDMDKSSTWP